MKLTTKLTKIAKLNMLLLAVAMTGCSSMSGKSSTSFWDGFGKKAETTEASRAVTQRFLHRSSC